MEGKWITTELEDRILGRSRNSRQLEDKVGEEGTEAYSVLPPGAPRGMRAPAAVSQQLTPLFCELETGAKDRKREQGGFLHSFRAKKDTQI